MGFLKKLIKGAVDTALVPVAVVKDVVTLGGVLTDRDMPGDETYTESAIRKVGKDAKNLYNELEE